MRGVAGGLSLAAVAPAQRRSGDQQVRRHRATGPSRSEPARDGFVVEWPMYSVSRRSLKLSRKTELGASGRCRISTSHVSKIAADRPGFKMRKCANDPLG